MKGRKMPSILPVLLALVLVCAAVFLYRLYRRKRVGSGRGEPDVTYVCDLCGSKDCICRKQ